MGPDGGIYICDWYNPVKGHMQYALRDRRRDKESGRIWRITAKNRPLIQNIPKIAGQPIPDLLKVLKRYEYRFRYWAKRELRNRNPQEVAAALDKWVAQLNKNDENFEHHRTEALWMYQSLGIARTELLKSLLQSPNKHARAAATRQLRYWHSEMKTAVNWLNQMVNDTSGLVRLEAVNAASYIGSQDALLAILDVVKHEMSDHLKYAFDCSVHAHTLVDYWKYNPEFMNAHPAFQSFITNYQSQYDEMLAKFNRRRGPKGINFEEQGDLLSINISALPERMMFDVTEFTVKPGQKVELTFTNPDITLHNLVFVEPGSEEEVGQAANDLARSPNAVDTHFIPVSDKIVRYTNLLAMGQSQTLSFLAPEEPGRYPYICTYPGHWMMMRGDMVVESEAPSQ